MSKDLYIAKDAIADQNAGKALDMCQDALQLSDQLTDRRAKRAVLRVMVRLHKWFAAGPQIKCFFWVPHLENVPSIPANDERTCRRPPCRPVMHPAL